MPHVPCLESMGRIFAEAIANMLWGDLVYPCALRDVDNEVFETLKPEMKKHLLQDSDGSKFENIQH